MKPFRDMTYAELRSVFRARCIGWLAADRDDDDMKMLCHASIHALIVEEWDKRLRGQLIEEVQSGAQFITLQELLDRLERRLAFRSAFERESNIALLGARLYVRILLRRERAEALIQEAAQ